MALVDQVTIHAQAGKGGDGVVRWLHLRGKDKGGPSGGDGGRGGDVTLVGVRDLAALSRYRYEKTFNAEEGGPGEKDLMHGANGKELLLMVPIGTVAHVVETGEEYEILHEGERKTVFTGGYGGKGNARFKSSTNQNPFEHTKGKPGQGGDILFSLRMIADAGFIGLPSAGKSSLLNELTRAKAKVGEYPFTTLEPNLGDFYGYILADIPGLIEGAALGKGLGIKFLKHIERTKILIHLVSADQENPLDAYKEVRSELEAFGRGLSEKEEIVLISKADLVSAEALKALTKELKKGTGREVLAVSIIDEALLKSFADALTGFLKEAAA